MADEIKKLTRACLAIPQPTDLVGTALFLLGITLVSRKAQHRLAFASKSWLAFRRDLQFADALQTASAYGRSHFPLSMTPRKASLIAAVGAFVVRLLVGTLRFRVDDRAGLLGGCEPPTVWLFWHNRLFVMPYFFSRYQPGRKGCALTSASKDGELLAAFLAQFGIEAVRGSSSRRGAIALRELISRIEQGYSTAITPDGPRGPRYQMSGGPITLAQSTGAKVLPVRVRYSRCWRLKSWDAFQIPKPFARVDVTLLPLETIAPTADAELFERERARIEAILRTEQADD
jgi:hypothetical protein